MSNHHKIINQQSSLSKTIFSISKNHSKPPTPSKSLLNTPKINFILFYSKLYPQLFNPLKTQSGSIWNYFTWLNYLPIISKIISACYLHKTSHILQNSVLPNLLMAQMLRTHSHNNLLHLHQSAL